VEAAARRAAAGETARSLRTVMLLGGTYSTKNQQVRQHEGGHGAMQADATSRATKQRSKVHTAQASPRRSRLPASTFPDILQRDEVVRQRVVGPERA